MMPNCRSIPYMGLKMLLLFFLLAWVLIYYFLIFSENDILPRIKYERERKRAVGMTFEAVDEKNDIFYMRYYRAVRALWVGNVSFGMLSVRLQNAKMSYIDSNVHNVNYTGQRKTWESKKEILCRLKKRSQVRTLDGTDEPFASLGWQKWVPSQPLRKLNGDKPFKTCAVVSSAASILDSRLGQEIDAHESVLRFNAAPTEGYERDVGSKTTIRIINSQIMSMKEHYFTESSLYKNITLVAWDPAPYSLNLHKWYNSPDFDIFTPYVKRRRRSPGQPFYILHPAFIWSLWDVLQLYTNEAIQPNPPSSGFIGIMLMMNLCQRVNVYEFIPSLRHTSLCHYYDEYDDVACTWGAYHPQLYEKLLIRKITGVNVKTIMKKGMVSLPGYAQIKCSDDAKRT